MPRPKKQADLCPNCYLFEQIEEPLIFRPGSSIMYSCGRSHTYDDSEVLQNLLMQVARKKDAVDRASRPQPEKQEEDNEKAPTKVQTDGGLHISQDDLTRLKSILGHFSDGSNMYGCLYALNEELKDTKAALAAAKSAPILAAGVKVSAEMMPNNDMTITAVIPEPFVQPLLDIAAANDMDAITYFNSVVDHAFRSGWFF